MHNITWQVVIGDYHGGGGYLLVMDYITLQLVMHNITWQAVIGDYHGGGGYLLVMGDYHHRPIWPDALICLTWHLMKSYHNDDADEDWHDDATSYQDT